VWKPKTRPAPREESKRDILAEHFGDDWRTNFLGPPTEDELAEQRTGDDWDPYQVLHVDPSATWDEIVAAHRHEVRVHHPDRLFGQSEEEQAESHERIRVINAAYEELKVRRGV
jgi:DnaJ-class molecular chaperone